MLNLFQLLYIVIGILFKLLRLSGIKALVAENICLRQQLIILTKNKQRCPNLLNIDRLIFSSCINHINPKRLYRLAILIKPATLIKLHKAFVMKNINPYSQASAIKNLVGLVQPRKLLI